MGKDFMDRFPKPLWGPQLTPRHTAREQRRTLVAFLNSDAANYITRHQRYADGGFSAGMLTSRLDFSASWARHRPAEQRDRRTIRGR